MRWLSWNLSREAISISLVKKIAANATACSGTQKPRRTIDLLVNTPLLFATGLLRQEA
jgi:hypothetical protein